MANKGIKEHELDLLRNELEAEKRKSMGIEEYANKKLKDYEKRVEEETRKKKEIERDNYELNNKAVENEDKLRELLR